MKTIIAALLGALSFLAQAAPPVLSGDLRTPSRVSPLSDRPSDCGSGMVRARVVGADAFEKASACEGLSRAHAFFVQHYKAPAIDGPPLTFRFESEARIACSDIPAKPGCKGPRVAAFFDAEKFEVVVTKSSSAWMRAKNRPYFTLPYDRELYVSVLAHEATHALSKQFYLRPPKTHAQDEYIAYASQLTTMGARERARVAAAYPKPQFEFSDELNINDLIHYSGPHAFGVMSWRHFAGPTGGRAMLERIYSGDFKPPTMEMP